MGNYILGISAFYHDSTACLVENNEIMAAAQEECSTRIEHDVSFFAQTINYCLKVSRINQKNINCMAFYDKPFLKFEWLWICNTHFWALLFLSKPCSMA